MSEKYLGEVSTPLLINQIKDNCTQKRTTLPIASIDELGHIYQYMGATSGNLVHGYFYECVSDGQDPANYSWSQVNVQPTAGTPTAATTTYDNTTSGLQATNVQNAIDEVEGRVDTVENKIPSTATSSNKLIDHDSLGTAAFKNSTPNVAPNNHNLVESNAVYNAITTALTSVYTPRGDLSCAELTSSLLIAANVGNIYEMSDSGTTSALFLQGAGQTIHVGDNVGIIQTGVSEYKFNLMANAFDLSDYQKKDLTQAVESATTVEGALSALSTNKADKVASATNGNFAGLNASGNLTDSGKKASDFATATALENEVVTRSTLGAHNLIENVATTTVYTDGNKTITFTVNSDGSVTVNGETGSTTNRGLNLNTSVKTVSGKRYILSGCPSDGNDNTFYLDAFTPDFSINVKDTGNGIEFIGDGQTLTVRVLVKLNTEVSNKIFYPMLRLATDADTTYRPYTPTNVELFSHKDNGVLGAKNLWAHGNQSVYQQKGFYVNIPNGKYIFSANVTSNDTDANTCLVYDLTNGKPLGYIGRGTNQSIIIDINNVSIINLYASTYAVLSAGDTATFNNVMIRRVNDTDPTYQPYAMTNQQLTGNMIYSTSEVDTGKIWTDGKKIYRKIYTELDMGSASSNAWQDFANITPPTNFSQLISANVVRTDNVFCDGLPVKVDVQNNKIQYINPLFASTTGSTILTIEYTKTT